MALIEYIEPFGLGKLFLGIGMMIICLVIAWIFYRFYGKFIQYFDILINRDAKYAILEEAFLDKIGKQKGIDLNKELVKKKMFQTKNKSIRRKIEDQIYEDMFGKDKEEKK